MLKDAWYELSPYLYAAVAFAILLTANTVAGIFAFILLLVALVIIVKRINYRSAAKTTFTGKTGNKTIAVGNKKS
jgi:hypothetical protein